MASTSSPAGQGLFDALSGAAGFPVNRPALNSQIANGQALAGLRTAQTQEALFNAQRAQEEQDASSQLEQAYIQNGLKPSDAHLAATISISNHGNAVQALQTLQEQRKLANTDIVSDPNQLNTPAQTAAFQGLSGKPLDFQTVPKEYAVNPGITAPQVQQTPLGAAETGAQNAFAGLHNAQTAAGGFNPHAGGAGASPMDPQAVAYGAYMLYKTGKMPSLGMGAGPARAAIISGAAQLAQQEASGQPVANEGFDQAIANGQDYTAAGRALGSYAGGPLGNQARALNNTTGHLRLYENTFNALQNGDLQFVNSVDNAWKKATGQGAPTTLQAMGSIIGPELTKILTNTNAGTGEERAQFAQNAGNLSNSPEQMGDAIHAVRGMLGRQAADLALQYHGATGRNDFSKRYLQPDVATDLELNPDTLQQPGGPGGGPPPAAPGPAPAGGPAGASPGPIGAPVRITSDDDYNKLPSGTLFMGPDNHIRKKP